MLNRLYNTVPYPPYVLLHTSAFSMGRQAGVMMYPMETVVTASEESTPPQALYTGAPTPGNHACFFGCGQLDEGGRGGGDMLRTQP